MGKRNDRVLTVEHRRKISEAMKGRQHTAEHNARVSAAKSGSVITDDHRRKISATLKAKGIAPPMVPFEARARGARCPQWRGGVSKPNELARKSFKYRTWRTAVFSRDNYTCVECRCRGGSLNADHIKPFASHPDLRFVLENGRTLCVLCHRNTPTYGVNLNKEATWGNQA